MTGPVGNPESYLVNDSKFWIHGLEGKNLMCDVSKIVCIMIFVALDLALWAAFCGLSGSEQRNCVTCDVSRARARALWQKHIALHFVTLQSDQWPMPHSSWPTRQWEKRWRKNWELKPTKCISLLLFSIIWIWKLHLKIY